jgi:hypothetical protein
VLVEQLHSVTASFDKCRAVRYQQSLAKELRQHRKVPQSAVSRQDPAMQHGLIQHLPCKQYVRIARTYATDMGICCICSSYCCQQLAAAYNVLALASQLSCTLWCVYLIAVCLSISFRDAAAQQPERMAGAALIRRGRQ